MKYKKSMFNNIIDNGNELRLYNSLNGANSLILVESSKYNDVKNIFNDHSKYLDSELFSLLLKHGYFVPDYIDEEVLRERNLSHVVNQTKLHLVIMPTEECNFRCSYCYETHEKGKMTCEVQDSIIKFVRKNIKDYTGLNVGWFGGEPLEAIDVIRYLSKEFIKICDTARKPFRAGMTTNAYALNADLYRELYKLHVYEYQISIDGLKEEHDKLRKMKDGSGTFDRIIKNIREIKAIDDIKASEIIIRTNFTKSIAKKLPEYVEFYNDLLSNDSRFKIQINMASDWGGDDVKNISDDLFDLKEYVNVFEKIMDIDNNIDFSYHLDELTPGAFKCYAGKRNTYCIGSDAKIYKCTESFDMPENNIGVLLPNGVLDINEYYLSLWENTARISNIEKCRNCSFSGCCLYSPCPRNTISSKDGTPKCSRVKSNLKNVINILNKKYFIKVK